MFRKINSFKLKILFFVSFIFATNNLLAQKAYLGVGLGNAFFQKYENNDGTTISNFSKQPKKPFVEVGILFNTKSDYLKIDAGLTYSNYEMNTSFKSGNIDIPIFYDLSYFAVKTGLDFRLFTYEKVIFKTFLHVSYDFLTSGTSKFNNVVNDLYRDKTLSRVFARYHLGINLNYPVTNFIDIYGKYNFANSIGRVRSDSNSGESYFFKTNSFSFGLLFKFDY